MIPTWIENQGYWYGKFASVILPGIFFPLSKINLKTCWLIHGTESYLQVWLWQKTLLLYVSGSGFSSWLQTPTLVWLQLLIHKTSVDPLYTDPPKNLLIHSTDPSKTLLIHGNSVSFTAALQRTTTSFLIIF